RLRPWHFPAELLFHVEFERARQRSFDRRSVDLTIALRRMAIACREERALIPDRQKDGAACRQFLAVEITAELARLLAVLPAEYLSRRHRKLSEKRGHRDFETRCRGCDIRFQIKRDMRQLHVWEVFRDRPHVAAKDVPTPILPDLDVQDLDLEYISYSGTTDVDWAGKNVISGPFLHLLVDLDDIRKNIEPAVLCRHPLGIAGGALDRHASRPQKFGGCVRRGAHIHDRPQLPGMIPASMP